MTRDDIIRMAREAGLHLATDVNWMPIIGLEYAEKFAALVRADEREACAKVCDAEFWNATKRDGDAAGVAAGNCAAEIRARGKA